MLLITSKSPGWGKQKPKMWGPRSALLHALGRNADMIGMDPSSICQFAVTWDGIPRIYDIINEEIFTSGGGVLEVEQGSVKFTHNNLSVNDWCAIPSKFYSDLLPSGDCTTLAYGRWDDYHHTGANIGYILGGVGVFLNFNATRNNWGFRDSGSHGWDGEFAPVFGKHCLTGLVKDYKNNKGYGINSDGQRVLGIKNGEGFRTSPIYTSVSIGRTSSWNNYYGFNGLFDFFLTGKGAWSENTTQQIAETPYALLMQIPRPVFFDLGAVAYTFDVRYYDTLFQSKNLKSLSVDSRLVSSLESSLSVDTKSKVDDDSVTLVDSKGNVIAFVASAIDSRSSVADVLNTLTDSKSKVLEDAQKAYYSLTPVTELATGSIDSKAKVMTDNTATIDSKVSVSALENRIIDTLLSVNTLNDYVLTFDTLVKVATLSTTSIDSKVPTSIDDTNSYDTKSVISNLQEKATDVVSVVENLLSEVTSTKIAVSQLEENTTDAKTAVNILEDRILDLYTTVVLLESLTYSTSLPVEELYSQLFDLLLAARAQSQTLPELFEALSKITLSFDGQSKVTTVFNAVSKIDLRRIE